MTKTKTNPEIVASTVECIKACLAGGMDLDRVVGNLLRVTGNDPSVIAGIVEYETQIGRIRTVRQA